MIFSPSEGRLALSRSCLIVYYGNYRKNSSQNTLPIIYLSKSKKDRPSFWFFYPILSFFHSCFSNYERLITFDGFRIIKSEILWYYQSQRSWIWKYLWKKYKNILSMLKMMVRHKIGPVMFIFDVREILITILSLYQSFFLSSSS